MNGETLSKNVALCALKVIHLNGLFLGFFMTYDIKSVLLVWARVVLTFFHFVVILKFEDKILMYIAPITA